MNPISQLLRAVRFLFGAVRFLFGRGARGNGQIAFSLAARLVYRPASPPRPRSLDCLMAQVV